MTEFVDGCSFSGVFVEKACCPGCGREVSVAGGRFVDHSRADASLPFEPEPEALPFGTGTGFIDARGL